MPPRAEIYDRHMRPLALNRDNLSAFVLPKEVKNKKQLISFLKKYFPHALPRLKRTDAHFIYIKRKLTQEEIDLIKQHEIEDIHLLKEPSRYYPLECANTIVGITDIDNVGLFGIELQYE